MLIKAWRKNPCQESSPETHPQVPFWGSRSQGQLQLWNPHQLPFWGSRMIGDGRHWCSELLSKPSALFIWLFIWVINKMGSKAKNYSWSKCFFPIFSPFSSPYSPMLQLLWFISLAEYSHYWAFAGNFFHQVKNSIPYFLLTILQTHNLWGVIPQEIMFSSTTWKLVPQGCKLGDPEAALHTRCYPAAFRQSSSRVTCTSWPDPSTVLGVQLAGQLRKATGWGVA